MRTSTDSLYADEQPASLIAWVDADSTVMHSALRKNSDDIVDRIADPRRLGHNTAHTWLVSTRLAGSGGS